MRRLLTLGMLLSLQVPAVAGFGAHGGDTCELNFQGLILLSAGWVESNKNVLGLNVGYQDFIDAYKGYTIRCDDKPLTLKGVRKTAINDTEKRTVTLDSDRFNQGSLLANQALVVHEGLVILKKESTDNYDFSKRVYTQTNAQFNRFFCVLHFNSGAGISDTVFELLPSPEEKPGAGLALFKNKTMYQARILRGNFDPSTEEMKVENERYILHNRLGCENSNVDPKVVTCNDILGPFDTKSESQGIDIIRTSFLLKNKKPTYKLEIKLPLLGQDNYAVNKFGMYLSYDLEKIWGPAQYQASSRFDYAPNFDTFMWSYCGVR